MNWLDYLVPLGTAAGGAASVYGLVVAPRQREHEQHERERAKLKAELAVRDAARDAFLDGVHPIEGVTDGAAPAAKRLQSLEAAVKGVVKGQSLIEKRMDESNGTGKRTEEKVDALAGLVRGIVKTSTDVKIDLHADADDLATLTDQSKSDLLNAIHESKE